MSRIKPNYREILRLSSKGLSQQDITTSVGSSKKTVNRILRLAKERNVSWPLPKSQTNDDLAKIFFTPAKETATSRPMPDLEHIHKELKRNGVNKKLLWREYIEHCRLSKQQPLMYSQFCYYIQQDEEKRQATMHIPRKPGERIEVDWAGDPAYITDRVTGEKIKAWVFVAVLPYSQYTFVEAFTDQKQKSWLRAHIDMYAFFGGVSKLLVPDNCKTAVIHNNNWYTPKLNTSYHELAAHYDTEIIPARVRKPKDKSSAEGNVGHISTWIIAALRNEQFFSLTELNATIRERVDAWNHRLFQKRDGSPAELFLMEEKPCLADLPAYPYEIAEWKTATVQYNYHISAEGMLYSVACALGNCAIDLDIKTLFVRIPDFLIEMEEARQAGTYSKALKKYLKPKLLILDEWLLEHPTENECHDIADLIHKRRRQSSTIFCSQYPSEGWYDQLGGANNPLAEAVLDRIIHDAYELRIEAIERV